LKKEYQVFDIDYLISFFPDTAEKGADDRGRS